MRNKSHDKKKEPSPYRRKGQTLEPSNRKSVKGKRGPRDIGESEIESLLDEQTQSSHFQAFRKNLPQNQSPKALFLKVIRAFNKHHIPYLVIGGIAVRKYDRVRKTEDLDIFVRPDTSTLKKTIEVYTPPHCQDQFLIELR